MKREPKRGIRGKNSLCFALIHCEYIYNYIYKSQSNLPNRIQHYMISFLIGYNSICKVDICYNRTQRDKKQLPKNPNQ